MIGHLKVKHPEKVSAYFVNYICQHVRFILSSPGARASHHRTMDLLISTQQVHPVHFLLRFSVLCYVFEFNLWAAFPTEKQILIWEYYWLVWLDLDDWMDAWTNYNLKFAITSIYLSWLLCMFQLLYISLCWQVLVEEKSSARILTLNRPGQLNVVSLQMVCHIYYWMLWCDFLNYPL